MKITDVIVHRLVGATKDPFTNYMNAMADQRMTVVVEVRTDEGITGWGESLVHGGQKGEVAVAYIEHYMKPRIIGKSPFDVEVIWEDLFHTTRPVGGGAAVNAISGIDVALWDVIGRAVNKPIHQLIGGAFRTEVMPYATTFYRKEGKTYPQAFVDEAQELIDAGFRAFKLKLGYGVKKDTEYIYALRRGIGDDMILACDANCAYDVPATRQILMDTEAAKLHFFEEPLKSDDIEGYKMLRNLTRTSLACGENLHGKYDFKRWITEGAVDIIQPDICSSGGITEIKKIAAMAQAFGTKIVPHVWGTGIGLAAALQVIASLPSSNMSAYVEEPMLEYDRSSHPFRDELILEKIVMKNGLVQVPMGPGIGVNVNTDCIREYEVSH